MYQETDIVQDLYNEIEHLIDIPFENKPGSPYNPVKPLDFHYKHHLEDEEEEKEEQGQRRVEEYDNEQKHDQQIDYHHNNDYSFERPILIESDSDDIEEEATTPGNDLHYSVSTCYQCDKPIPYQSNNTLSVANTNQLCCSDCSNFSKKKGGRSRSSSFTFSQIADKLKQSFGHSSSSNSNLLNPAGIKNVDRRKSMPSMNSIFQNDQQQLQPSLSTSPQPSRPSSRASSFIEDLKQLLSPLSRKSSRNSMHQEYTQQQSEMKRKTSHNSLLDAFNLCKPSLKPQRQNSYERRIIQTQQHDDNSWNQEDAEVMGVHCSSSRYFQQPCEEQNSPQHIPLRRKQIKQIESRQDRMEIYSNAYMEVMSLETELIPWIVKQTQKGPPDAWFGYTPPARVPKKIMGLFKRKAITATDLRTQQQQLGDALLNKSTPLLQHRLSNSNLSRSPSNQSFIASDQQQQEQQLVSSPSALIQQNHEEQEEYFDKGAAVDHRFTSPNSYSSFDPRSPSTSLSPNSNIETVSRTPSATQQEQLVSILKKSNSNVSMNKQYHHHEPSAHYYDDYSDEDVDQYNENQCDKVKYDDQYDEQYYAPPPPQLQASRQKQRSRPSSSGAMIDEYYGHRHNQQQLIMPPPTKEKRKQQRHSSASPEHHNHYQQQQMYMVEPFAMIRRGRSNSGSHRSDYDRDDYYSGNENGYYHQASPPVQQERPSSRHRYQQPQYYEEEVNAALTTAYYNDSIALNKKKRQQHSPHFEDEEEYYEQQKHPSLQEEEVYYYEEEEDDDYYQQSPPDTGGGDRKKRVSSSSKKDQQQRQYYYGLGVKVTPYMMEEWEMTLDDLCDLYPRLDRHYINDFLRSAQGDFVTAKEMIMDMIMEIR